MKKTPRTDYKVGYGRPPKHTQFKKGQSGNKKGKPKGAKNKPKGADIALRSLIIRESQVEVDLSINGVKETLPVVQGILKQNNVKALKGDSAATRLSIRLLKEAAKEAAEHDQKEQDTRMEVALLAQNVKNYWTEKIKNGRKHRIPLELPIPHPDHILIDPKTLEVELKCATVESVNAAIDLIGKLAKMEADSIAYNPKQNLWTEKTMLTLPCEHIDRETLDFSIPMAPSHLDQCEGAIYVFRSMVEREAPKCEYEACSFRNHLVEEQLLTFACYTMSRTQVPYTDPLWREYGPKLVEAYLDRMFYYGPEPDVEALKVHGASVPDPREDQLRQYSCECADEVEFRTTFRDWICEGMQEDWFRRFEPEFMERRNVHADYLTFCLSTSDDPDQPLPREFIDTIEWPNFLNRYQRDVVE